MCGIVGVAGVLTQQEEKLMSTLLILDSLRGIDSTGIAVVGRNNDVKVAKAIGNPFELLGTKAYDQALLGANKVAIGHNRYGTQGKVSKSNAHPFEFDTLVGVHNGTLASKYKLIDSAKFDVDSENLYHHIDQNGLHSALEHLDGAWSLVWWDKTDTTLNFLRNKERPMYITKNMTNTCMFWASERWMLEVALSRALIQHHPIVETTPDTHYSYVIGANGVIEKPHAVEAKSRAVVFTKGPMYTTWVNGGKVVHSVGKGDAAPLAGSSYGSSTVGATTSETTEKKSYPLTERTKHLLGESSYAYSKDVDLVVLGVRKDSYGARYAICEDEFNLERTIRLYIKNGDVEPVVGDTLNASIGPLVIDNKTDVWYYKVIHNTVKYLNDLLKEDVGVKVLKDADGKGISEEEFMSRYCECAACTGWVDPTKPHRFVLSSDDAICHECVDDKNVSQYIRLR